MSYIFIKDIISVDAKIDTYKNKTKDSITLQYQQLDKDKKIIGQDVRVEIKKDKLSGNRGVKFSLPYDNKMGFDIERDIVNNAIDLGIIKVAGSWYSYDSTKLGQGIDTVTDLLRDNPELCLEIVTLCKEKF